MITRIAFPTVPQFNVKKFAKALQSKLESTADVGSPQKLDGKISMSIGNSTIKFGASSKPIKWDLDEQAKTVNSDSIDMNLLRSHQAHLAFRISGKEKSETHAEFMNKIVSTVVEQYPEAVGVFNETSSEWVPLHQFIEFENENGQSNEPIIEMGSPDVTAPTAIVDEPEKLAFALVSEEPETLASIEQSLDAREPALVQTTPKIAKTIPTKTQKQSSKDYNSTNLKSIAIVSGSVIGIGVLGLLAWSVLMSGSGEKTDKNQSNQTTENGSSESGSNSTPNTSRSDSENAKLKNNETTSQPNQPPGLPELTEKGKFAIEDDAKKREADREAQRAAQKKEYEEFWTPENVAKVMLSDDSRKVNDTVVAMQFELQPPSRDIGLAIITLAKDCPKDVNVDISIMEIWITSDLAPELLASLTEYKGPDVPPKSERAVRQATAREMRFKKAVEMLQDYNTPGLPEQLVACLSNEFFREASVDVLFDYGSEIEGLIADALLNNPDLNLSGRLVSWLSLKATAASVPAIENFARMTVDAELKEGCEFALEKIKSRE